MATEVGNIFIGLHVDVGEMGRFASAAGDVEKHSRRMNTALGATTNSVRSLRSQMSQSTRFKFASDSLRDITRTTDEVSRLRAAMIGLAAISGAGITGSFTAAYLLQTADRARLLGNQVRTVTSDFANYGAVQDKLFGVAQRTRSSLEATTNLYARTSRAVEKFGMSQENVLKITETVQKAFSIGGATPQEAAGAALQLSQGIASDRFGGEEFRSVAENAPVLLNAIAKALDTSIGGLRQMSMDGKLTAQTVTAAILKSADEINAKYAQMTPTVAQAFTTLDNAFLRYVGDTDKAYGVTNALAGALSGIANNFENIAYWVTRATALVATFYAANKVQNAVRSTVAGVRETNAAARKYLGSQVDRRTAIEGQQANVASMISDAKKMVPEAENAALARQQANVNKALEKQFLSQQQLNALQKDRGDLAGKLADAQRSASVIAGKDIEVARERVRLDQQRVIEAQQATIQEERILAARQAQAVAKAGGRVDVATAAVSTAQGRVAETAAAIAKEKELAKVKLAGEIDARRASLVTAVQRLNSVQQQIAELRSVQDLSGFDQTFGKQYRSLLEQQQKAISSTQKLRGEIGGLQTKLDGIASGAQATRGITAAMNQHAAAVAKVQAATDALAKAEATRMAIANAPVSSRTLEQRLAAEQRSIKQYETSINMLQQKMGDLRTATVNGFDTGPARKLLSQIDALDKKIVSAQAALAQASSAVQSAGGGDAELLRASLDAQEKAQRRINSLQSEANALAESHVVATQRIIAAQQRLNLLRRAGNNVLGFFGGWTGVAITGALMAASAAVAYFASEAQKAEAKSEGLTEEMKQLGLLSESTAGKIDKTTQSLDSLQSDRLRQKLRDVRSEMERLKGQTGFFEGLFKSDSSQTLGDVSSELDKLMAGLNNPRMRQWNETQIGVVKSLKAIVDEARSGKTPIEELQKRLEQIAKQPLDANMDSFVQKVRELLPQMAALAGYVQKIGDISLSKTINGVGSLNAMGRSEARSAEAMADQTAQAGKDFFEKKTLRDANLSDYEAKIKSIMDSLVKEAEKVGTVLLQSDARKIAEKQYATEQAKSGLLNLIGLAEGTDKGRKYNETLGYGKFTGGDVNLTQMTISEVLALQKKMLADPSNTYNSSAVGRYQITSETLRDFMKRLGLSGDTIFSADVQDRIANEIIRSTKGDTSALRGRWEGLKNVSDEQIRMAAGESFQNLPAMDESTQKWLDGMKDLDLRAKIAQVDQFKQSVIQQAMAMGATNDEVKQYVAALTSGNLDAVPEKFKKIEEAMKAEVDSGFLRQLGDLKLEGTIGLMSDLDQKTIQTARSFGIGEEKIRAFVQAATSGDITNVPQQMAMIRDELQRVDNIQLGKAMFNGFMTDLRNALQDGKVTWEEWGNIAANVLDKIIDKLQNQLVDALFSVNSAQSSGGGGGGFLGSLFSGVGKLFGLYDDGGWTGPGGKKTPKGVVHADEFVFTKKATQRAGVKNLYRLMDYLETGNLSAIADSGMPGFEDGGYVGSVGIPSVPSPSSLMGSSGPAVSNDTLHDSQQSLHITVGLAKDGLNIYPEVIAVAQQVSGATVGKYNKVVPGRISQAQARGTG